MCVMSVFSVITHFMLGLVWCLWVGYVNEYGYGHMVFGWDCADVPCVMGVQEGAAHAQPLTLMYDPFAS